MSLIHPTVTLKTGRLLSGTVPWKAAYRACENVTAPSVGNLKKQRQALGMTKGETAVCPDGCFAA
nr:hypothetical protein [uncultured Brevundimonas sp.]